MRCREKDALPQLDSIAIFLLRKIRLVLRDSETSAVGGAQQSAEMFLATRRFKSSRIND